MAPHASITLKDAVAVRQLSSHTYLVNFIDEFCIGSVPHGGYVTASFLEVARVHFNGTLASQNQPDSITLHLDFLRRTSIGPALFTVKDVKLGRQTSVIHISLCQSVLPNEQPPFKIENQREEVVGYITNSSISSQSGLSLSTEFTLDPPSPPVNLQQLSLGKDLSWAWKKDMPFSSFRKATKKVQYHFPIEGQVKRGIYDEWLRFSTGEKFTNVSLGFISDLFPTPVEVLLGGEALYDVKSSHHYSNHPAKFWYPTLVLNLDIKKSLPPEGVEWLFIRTRPKEIKNGRMDLEVIIMDDKGDIVALSHHVCFILGSERNTAQRRDARSSL